MLQFLIFAAALGSASMPKDNFSAEASGVVDLVEGDYASVELTTGELVDCPTSLLPEGIREGGSVSVPAECK